MNTTFEPDGYKDIDGPELGLSDYLSMVKRRRKPMFITAGVVFFIALLAALFWPPTFRSSATILIEEQEIPQDMVRSTITTFAQQQIQIIQARVMTLSHIMDMVESYELYDEDELARIPRMEIAKEFVEAVTLDLVSAEVLDPKSGRPMEAVIAFTIDFDWDSPRSSLNVANELVNLFLNENLKTRTRKAANTTEFLAKEAQDINKELHELENTLSEFKAANSAALPESFQINLQRLSQMQTQLLTLQSRKQQIDRRALEIDAQLNQMSPYAPTVLASGEAVLADVDRLKALQSEYRKKSSVYSEDHPDLKRLSREIDALAAEVGHAGDRGELAKLLNDRKSQLHVLKAKYTADHPEVLAQERLVTQLEEQLAMADEGSSLIEPDNPAYLMLDTQLKSLEIERAGSSQEIASLTEQVDTLNEAITRAPTVEREYKDLIRNLEVTQAKYLDLKVKLKEAELSGQLEQGRKGQRFTMIEPPTLPEEPISPNRLALIFLGLVLAAAAGLGAVAVLEATDESVRGEKALIKALGVAPLVVVSYLETPEEQEANRPDKRLYYLLGGGLALFLLALVAIHFFYKPLDVLWYVVLRKLGIG